MIEKLIINSSKWVIEKLSAFSPENDVRRNFRLPIFVVSVTTRCNFHCPHCLRGPIDNNKTLITDLSLDTFETVLKEGKKINFNSISFTGGEPILSPHFKELINLACKYSYNYYLTSNGWMYKDCWQIIKNSRQNLKSILLSVDGATADVHDSIRNKAGSFEKVIEAVRFFRKEKIPVIVTFVVMKQNYHQIQEIAELCLELGVSMIKYVAVLGLGEENICGIDENKKLQALKKISALKNRMKNKMGFILTPAMLDKPSFKNNFKYPGFCRNIFQNDQLYIDHDGAMLFCCDLNRKYVNKPLVGKLGFKKCLEMNYDIINKIKKQYASDLLNNCVPSDMSNFCDACNYYAERFYNESAD